MKSLHEIQLECQRFIELHGERACIPYIMDGIHEHGTRLEMWSGGPEGTVAYQYDESRVMVLFHARTVLNAIQKELIGV